MRARADKEAARAIRGAAHRAARAISEAQEWARRLMHPGLKTNPTPRITPYKSQCDTGWQLVRQAKLPGHPRQRSLT
jgi:hypothetical protein